MKSAVEHGLALLEKARGDFYVLERLASDSDAPVWILGFHAQQAVEKALKAVLSCHGTSFPHTHNLVMLLELLRRDGHSRPPDGDDLATLIPFGVALRYEAALEDEILPLERTWALHAARRTLEWAEGWLAHKE
jgi:HEPN domain-containing protein